MSMEVNFAYKHLRVSNSWLTILMAG